MIARCFQKRKKILLSKIRYEQRLIKLHFSKIRKLKQEIKIGIRSVLDANIKKKCERCEKAVEYLVLDKSSSIKEVSNLFKLKPDYLASFTRKAAFERNRTLAMSELNHWQAPSDESHRIGALTAMRRNPTAYGYNTCGAKDSESRLVTVSEKDLHL